MQVEGRCWGAQRVDLTPLRSPAHLPSGPESLADDPDNNLGNKNNGSGRCEHECVGVGVCVTRSQAQSKWQF